MMSVSNKLVQTSAHVRCFSTLSKPASLRPLTVMSHQTSSCVLRSAAPQPHSRTCLPHAKGSAVASFTTHKFTSNPASDPSAEIKLPKVLHTVAEVRAMRRKLSSEGKELGFVPTMGALHAGHVALAARSMRENASTIVSIFVNPTQFLAHEDLGSYPRTLDSDLIQLGQIGVPYVFAPSVKDMYPSWPEYLMYVDMAGADNTSEGRQRPTHFRGVATVVSKLFNIVAPTRAYFGQKDGMQCVVLRRLVRDLDFDIDIRISPTVRARDGLALSSRNVYLSEAERNVAPIIFKALTAANQAYLSGERDVKKLKQAARQVLESQPMGKCEYVSLASADSGVELTEDGATFPELQLDANGNVKSGGAMLSVAYKLGKPRLIDNCILGQELRPGN